MDAPGVSTSSPSRTYRKGNQGRANSDKKVKRMLLCHQHKSTPVDFTALITKWSCQQQRAEANASEQSLRNIDGR